MSYSYLTSYEMMHIPCPPNPQQHHDAELGLCALNVDGVCIYGGTMIGAKCYYGMLSAGGQGYHAPGQTHKTPGGGDPDCPPTSGKHTTWYTGNQKYSARAGQASATNPHAITTLARSQHL
jgi:hypothetical protein